MFSVFFLLLPSLYAACATLYLVRFAYGKVVAPGTARHPVIFTLLVQAGYMVTVALKTGACPILGVSDGFVFLAAAIVLVYLGCERYSHQRTTGFMVLPLSWLVLLFGFWSRLLISSPSVVKDIPLIENMGSWPHLHAALMLLSCACFLVSFSHAILYIILYHDLKTGTFGLTFERLPALNTLEKITVRLIIAGFVLFVAGLLAGHHLLKYLPEASFGDPKMIFSALALFVYTGCLLGYWSGKLRGYGVAIASLLGFIFICLTIGVPFVAFSYHNFN